MEPRNYQKELFELSRKENSIVYLGTGSGKTFISVMMIKDFFAEAKAKGRKIAMVVPSVPLVNQQSRVIHEQCTFARVGKISGDDGVDIWDAEKWKRVLDSLDVIIFIHQVLLDALSHNYIGLRNIQLLIFDECHHTFKDNPYNMIMKEHYFPLKSSTQCAELPHIMGLSASVVISQCNTEEKFISEKQLLERNLDSKVVTTKDLDNYIRFVTQPEEILVSYGMPTLSSDITGFIEKGVNAIEKILAERILYLEGVMGKSRPRMSIAVQNATTKKKLYALNLNNVIVTYDTLGLFGAYKLICRTLDETIPHAKLNAEEDYELKLIKALEKAMASSRTVMEAQLSAQSERSELETLRHFSSPRVHCLLRVIQDFIRDPKFSSSSLCGLVFVQRRDTARVLFSLIKEISSLDPGFKFLSPAYVVGHNASEFNKGIDEMKKVEDTLCKFRSGHYNFIVSTSVLEEGMDLKQCNLVVRFDDIQTYRSYVQSKGRARAKPSKFVIMYPSNQMRTIDEKMGNYRNIENMSIHQCHTVPFEKERLSEEDEDEEEEDEPPYYVNPDDKFNSAKICSATAISLLYQYISSITTDKFTTLAPYWEYGKSTSRPQNLLSSMLEEPKYVCRVTLPHKTPLTAPIQGALRSSMKKAKRSAALKACSILHQIGEFNDLLIPRMKNLAAQMEEELDDGLDEDDEGAKPGTRRFRRHYAQRKLLRNDNPVLSSDHVFIYALNMNLLSIRSHNPKRYTIYDPKDNPVTLGLCLVSPLSKALLSSPIRLYSRSGLVEVKTSLVSSHLSGKEILSQVGGLQPIMKFTQLIYEDVLRVLSPWMNALSESQFMECSDPLVLPLVDGKLDMNFIHSLVSGGPEPPSSNPKDILERVVTRIHKDDPQRYFVENIVGGLSPLSFLDESTSFSEHYFRMYGLEIRDPDQPLIRLSNADSEFFAYSTETFNKKDNKLLELSNEAFFRTRCLAIPELVRTHPVPASLWKDLQILPYILERMNQIQNSIELFKELCPLGRGSSEENGSTVKTEPSFESLIDLQGESGISSTFDHFELFKSITLSNAGEEFDLERNEILGDSLLKILSSIYLFFEIKYKDEGYLSFYRSKIVGNRNLLRIGEILGSLNLGGILNAVKLSPRLNWQVPFFNNCKSLEEEVLKMNNRYRREAPKDCLGSLNIMDVLNEDLLKELKKIIEEEEGNGLEGFYEKLTQKLLSKEEKDGKSMLPHLRVYVSLSDKCIADAVESIIGVYLLHNGIKATIQMMGLRLGLNFSPNVPVEKNIVGDSKSSNVSKTWFTPPKDAIQENGHSHGSALNRLLLQLQYQTIEEVIGYKFKEKTFILQAFTHSSYSYNNITDSYERLEFLGDAVLDYLVSAYIFVEYPAYGPGKVTDARSAVVNNVTLALITIKAGLHCHLLHSEPLLLSRIDSTIASVNFENRGGLSESDLFEMRCSLLSETECPILEDIDVPKALGDVVESLLGAVFLDSGFHLPTVWEVFKRLCPQLDSLICAKPKNYVARLYELYPNRIFFTSSKKVGNLVERVVSLKMNDGQVYKAKGIGPKGKVAKNSAAKCLMRSLVKIKELPPEII